MDSLSSLSPVREPSVSEVKSELQSVLSSKEFRQSRGLTKLLRYICSRALLDDTEPITEYTIAVDVLGKAADFKDSKDANARVEMHRLRKRLVEFYENEGAGHRIRIAIPTGNYFPQFLVHEETGEREPMVLPSLAEPPDIAVPEPIPDAVHSSSQFAGLLRSRSAKIAAAILAIASFLLAIRVFSHSDGPLDSLWRPVFSSTSPILLCIGNVEGGHHVEPGTAPTGLSVLQYHGLNSQIMLIDDAATLSRFAGLLQAKGKPYRVVSQSETTFADLQNGPAVLIGLSNNYWTERLVGKLRFWLEHREPRQLILRDREHPERSDWMMDYSTPYLNVTRDYALVLRVLDPKTEQMVISAAGISVFGTLAAGEFLTDPEQFRKIEAVAPKGWKKMNFEMVLSTDVIRGKSGHATIIATHFW